jgi:integrase
MATVKFILQSKTDSAPIYCRLSHGRAIYLKVKTGLVCDAGKWSKTKGTPIAKCDATKNLKSQLDNLSTAIVDAFNADNGKGLIIDKNWLLSVIDANFERRTADDSEYLTACAQHYIDNLPYKVADNGQKVGVTPATIGKYKNIKKLIVEFEQHTKKRYLAKDVNIDFRTEFIKYLTTKKNLTSNTVGRYLKFVKTFALDARKRGIEISLQIESFKGYTIKTPKVILNFDELELIKKQQFTFERLNIARDWLLIGCYTGQRVSDLLRMNKAMIQNIESFKFIEITQVKSKKTVQIPIHDEVATILKKYNGNFPPIFTANQSSNAAQFNGYLKTICKQAGLTELTESYLRNEKTYEYEKGSFEKWRLIGTHVCRRSFASNFYGLEQYPTPLLMNITAHATEQQFLNYIGKKPIEYSLQLAKIWAKEAAKPNEQPQLAIVKEKAVNE